MSAHGTALVSLSQLGCKAEIGNGLVSPKVLRKPMEPDGTVSMSPPEELENKLWGLDILQPGPRDISFRFLLIPALSL